MNFTNVEDVARRKIAENCIYRVCIKKVKNTVNGKHPFTYLFCLELIYFLNSVCKNHN